MYAEYFNLCLISVRKLFKMPESGSDPHMLFQRKKFRARDTPTLGVQPQRYDGQEEGGQRWRKHGMDCLSCTLKLGCQLRKVMDFLYGMRLSTLYTPGHCSPGAPLSPQPHRRWREMGESKYWAANCCCHSIHGQNPAKCCTNFPVRQRGQETLTTAFCCCGVHGDMRALRAWPGSSQVGPVRSFSPTSFKKICPLKYLFKFVLILAVNVSSDGFSITSLGKLYLPLRVLGNRPSPAVQPTFALAQFHPITLSYIFTYHADMLNNNQKMFES